jgi:AraC-like DNA-binding protein
MLISAVPGSLLWPAAMIVWGPGYTSSKHSHHCVQLVMALRGNLRVRKGPGEAWAKCGAILVKPDAAHEVDLPNSPMLLAFVDPESELGTALLAHVSSDITRLDRRTVLRWREALGDPATLSASRVEPWVRAEFLPGRRRPWLHPRVKRVLGVLREELGTGSKFSLQRLADVAGLSRSRFMHVFTESVGVPLRPYILWLRLQRACGELMRGASISEAAQHSGFSDAAHLTRTLRRMLGTTPGELARRRQVVREVLVESN